MLANHSFAPSIMSKRTRYADNSKRKQPTQRKPQARQPSAGGPSKSNPAPPRESQSSDKH